MARRSAGHDGTGHDQSPWPLFRRRLGTGEGSTTSASRTDEAWETGLAGLPYAQESRNVIISDDKVREFVATAYRLDDKFGLLTDTLAITGARPSQVVRLRVEDLRDHPVRPKLMMPKSEKAAAETAARKGRTLFGADHRPVGGQAESSSQGSRRRCAAAAAKRRQTLGKNPGQNYHRQVDKVVTAIGLDPAEVTMYALRHSSIVRMLLQNIPIRLVARCITHRPR